MKKIIQNRTILGFAAISLSILILLVIQPIVASKINEQKEVVRAKIKINQGQQITEDMVELVKIATYNMPNDLLLKEEVIGKYVVDTIYSKDFFTSEKVSVDKLSVEQYFNDLKEGEGAISIPLKELATGLSGKLEQNDIVRLVAVSEESFVPESLQYVKVLAVTDDQGKDKEIGAEEKKADTLKTVTLLATERQARDLAFYEEHGKIYFMLVYRGGEEEREKYLSLQKEILLEIEEREKKEAEEKVETKVETKVEAQPVKQEDVK